MTDTQKDTIDVLSNTYVSIPEFKLSRINCSINSLTETENNLKLSVHS